MRLHAFVDLPDFRFFDTRCTRSFNGNNAISVALRDDLLSWSTAPPSLPYDPRTIDPCRTMVLQPFVGALCLLDIDTTLHHLCCSLYHRIRTSASTRLTHAFGAAGDHDRVVFARGRQRGDVDS